MPIHSKLLTVHFHFWFKHFHITISQNSQIIYLLWSLNIKWCPVKWDFSNRRLASNCSFKVDRNKTLLVLVTSNQTPRGWDPNQLCSPPKNVKVNYYIPLTMVKKSKVNYYIRLTRAKQTRVKHLFQLFKFVKHNISTFLCCKQNIRV